MSTDTDIIIEVVEEWTRDHKIFTAFDISVEARKRGMVSRHRHVKQEIHDILGPRVYGDHQRHLIEQMQSMGASVHGYKRDAVEMPGADINPFLYYPADMSLEEAKRQHPVLRAEQERKDDLHEIKDRIKERKSVEAVERLYDKVADDIVNEEPKKKSWLSWLFG